MLPALLLAVAACDAPEQPGAALDPPEARISAFDTLVTTESGLLGGASSMDVAGDGSVWIADRVNHRLLRLAPDGEEVSAIGREGSGPGEFQRPVSVAALDGVIFVFDFGNRRVVELDGAGEALGSRDVATSASTLADLGTGGTLAVSNAGTGDHLVGLVPAGADEPVHLGEARAAMPSEISPQRIGEEVEAGEIPQVFRNNVLPVMHPGGDVFAAVQAEGVVERHTPEGELLWQSRLPAEEVDAALEDFFQGWRDGVDWPRSFPVPWTARWGEVVGDELWLLADAAEGPGSTILVLAAGTGEFLRRLHLELPTRASVFAADAERGLVYLALPDEAILLRGGLP